MTRHHLGALRLKRTTVDLSELVRLERLVGGHAHLRGALSRLVHRTGPTTDLLAALPAADGDRPWLQVAADALQAVRGAELLDCEHESGAQGFVALAAMVLDQRTQVRPGDTLHAGVAVVRLPDTPPVVEPRIYRVVCTNGSLLHACRGALCHNPADLGQAVRDALDPGVLQRATEGYQLASRIRVDDPFEVLARLRLAGDPRAIAREFQRAGDPSAWGLANAATALARHEPRLPRRLELERDAARILAAVHTRPPARARRTDLDLVPDVTDAVAPRELLAGV